MDLIYYQSDVRDIVKTYADIKNKKMKYSLLLCAIFFLITIILVVIAIIIEAYTVMLPITLSILLCTPLAPVIIYDVFNRKFQKALYQTVGKILEKEMANNSRIITDNLKIKETLMDANYIKKHDVLTNIFSCEMKLKDDYELSFMKVYAIRSNGQAASVVLNGDVFIINAPTKYNYRITTFTKYIFGNITGKRNAELSTDNCKFYFPKNVTEFKYSEDSIAIKEKINALYPNCPRLEISFSSEAVSVYINTGKVVKFPKNFDEKVFAELIDEVIAKINISNCILEIMSEYDILIQ